MNTFTLKYLLGVILIFCTLSNKINAQCDVLICNASINVSLDSNGEFLLTPDIILNGDYSSCTNAFSTDPSDVSRLITCADVGQTLTFFVYDIPSGNSCWTSILVEDKLAPAILCPPDLTLECSDDYTVIPGVSQNPAFPPFYYFGNFIGYYENATDNCGVDSVAITNESVTLDQCGVGAVFRVYTAFDASGNFASCSHLTTLFNLNPFGADDIIWPLDYNSPDCVDLSPQGLPAGYNEPQFVNTECSLIAFAYEDQILATTGTYCGKILRTWTVIDWCIYNPGSGNGVWTYTQVINFSDNTTPTIICENTDYCGYDASCMSESVLLSINATDDCFVGSLDYSWNIDYYSDGTVDVSGTGNNVMHAMPFGNHDVLWTITDFCGNITTCNQTVTVLDCQPPFASTLSTPVVNLTSIDGEEVTASSLDDMSFDNCALSDLFLIQVPSLGPGQNGPPPSAVTAFTFTCLHLGMQTYDLWVFDEAGNARYATSVILVQDNGNICPECDLLLSCPFNITIDCRDDYTNTTITGEATATSNCPPITISYSDITAFDDFCGEGVVTRTWLAVDDIGHTATCEQSIVVVNLVPFNESDIIWPADLTTEDCMANTDPALLPPPYDAPQFSTTACKMLDITWSDVLIGDPNSGCYRIYRAWQITDNCQQPSASWIHTQIITAVNSIGPVFSSCNDFTFCADANTCDADIVLETFAEDDCSSNLNYSFAVDIDNNGSIDITGTGPVFQNILPVGQHTISWTAIDDCGNFGVCSQLIIIEDCTAPVAVAQSNTILTIGNSGTATLTAANVDDGSYDNCGITEMLLVYPSNPNTGIPVNGVPAVNFGCQDLGVHFVDFWVGDAAGNWSITFLQVIVSDPLGLCNCPEFLIINQPFYAGDNIIFTTSDYISTSSVIGTGANITFDAGNEIIINAGFEVEAGAVVLLNIGGCASRTVLKNEKNKDKKQ